ncbi:MAG: SpoIIIAH-like family protein, partial [Oscillospiraceae bacterium]|nr:SpoIIIAH-like family protein [Oscillospiraceae bacterium]
SSSEASQAVKDDALAGIAAMAEYTVCEADIENLLMAKGFKECLVFMRDDSVSVTVGAPKEGLTSAQVAQITDVVMSETGFGAEKIKIVEVK